MAADAMRVSETETETDTETGRICYPSPSPSPYPSPKNSLMRRNGGAVSRFHWCAQPQHVSQQPRQLHLQFTAVDDQIEHAVLEQEFGALKAVRQLLLDRLLDHAWPGETDQ